MGSAGFDKYKGYASHDTMSIACPDGFDRSGSNYLYGENDVCVLDVSSDFSSISSLFYLGTYTSNGSSYTRDIRVPFATGASITLNNVNDSSTVNESLSIGNLFSNVYFYIEDCKVMMHINSSAYFSTGGITLMTYSDSSLSITLNNFAIGIFGYA